MPHLLSSILVLAEIALGSWNLNWFPSGRSEHRASARVEAANCEDAAEQILAGPKHRRIVFLQELRDGAASSNLASRLPGMKPAVTSAFRRHDRRLDWQQCAILTDLPVLEASWAPWQTTSPHPPRGYAFALIDAGRDGVVACWCLHLKSNYGATTPERKADNIAKREAAIRELLTLIPKVTAPDGRPLRHVIAGDFNTDPYSGAFKGENTLSLLSDFTNPFDDLPLSLRGTHPGKKSYPASTIDFILFTGFRRHLRPELGAIVPLTDHRMVWIRVGGQTPACD